MSLRMRGINGELRKGYRVVARLGQWSMDEGGRVEAVPVEINTFLLEQETDSYRYSLWLWMGKRAWVWQKADVRDRGTPFVVHVEGAPAIRDV